jgi:hypothetical protein
LPALNSLRNTYAHEIDVNLAQFFDKGFVRESGEPLFSDLPAVRESIGNDPAAGAQTLLQIRDVTFGWLHEVATQHGIGT